MALHSPDGRSEGEMLAAMVHHLWQLSEEQKKTNELLAALLARFPKS